MISFLYSNCEYKRIYVLVKILAFVLSFVFSKISFAQMNLPSIHETKLPLNVGYFNAREGKSQHISMLDMNGNDYTLNSSNQQNVLVGAGVYIPTHWHQIDLGLHAFYFNTTGVSGTIVQEGYFSNLAYNYNVINTPIYLSGQKELNLLNLPYNLLIHGGIGPNIVSLYNYSETPLNSFSKSDHTFSSTARAQFSANAGLGIKLSKQFELSYQFFYLGQSHLNPKNEGVLNSLQTINMYANTLVLTLII